MRYAEIGRGAAKSLTGFQSFSRPADHRCQLEDVTMAKKKKKKKS